MNVRRFRGSFVTIEDCTKVQSCVRVGEYVDNIDLHCMWYRIGQTWLCFQCLLIVNIHRSRTGSQRPVCAMVSRVWPMCLMLPCDMDVTD